MNTYIPYGRQFIDDNDIEAVVSVLKGDWLTCGPMVTRFEDIVREYLGVKHAIAVCNGTAALHLCCLALGIQKGDTGVTSPLTFLASANCVAYCGGRPDFVDIEPTTYCLSSRQLEAYIRGHGVPKVVIPVDFAGVPAELPRFSEMAAQYGFSIIEDAAHSLGSTYNWRGHVFKCGSCRHSDMAIFSFHPVKTVTAGEGGMVLTNDDVLAKRVRMLANHGMEREVFHFKPWPIDNATGELQTYAQTSSVTEKAPWLYQQQLLGYNFRITDIQCALGASQFMRLDAIVKRRREIVTIYDDAFKNNPNLICPPHPSDTDPAYHLYVLRFVGKARHRRAEICRKLRESGIFAQVHYIPVYLQPWYREHFGYCVGKCPVAESVYGNCLSIPLYPSMLDSQVRTVIDIVNSAL